VGTHEGWCNAACLPDDADLAADLSAVEYGYDAGDAILLDYNCTGDPGNYTVGMNVAWGIKYRMP